MPDASGLKEKTCVREGVCLYPSRENVNVIGLRERDCTRYCGSRIGTADTLNPVC